jgi:Asp-tRNA(Asn)/Glu-tRNA(Gln) amidotransferase C subunit
MAKNQKKMQMVEDDEVENVGIMQGFMDDIEELMEEIAEAEMSGGEDQDMAKLMDRRPDSPEVLMNNLRGDYRSIDARREELADLVGMSAAVETPDDVLALLQPVLAQQGIEALTPSSSLPFGTMAPAAAMPPPPMEMAAAGLPTPSVDPSGVGSLPMGMAEGGIVQNFQDGSGEAGVTPATGAASLTNIDPALIQAARERQLALLQAPAVDLMARTAELTPTYQDILGTGDKDAIRAQMLFDIGQAALGFAGNVGPQGQALRGSMAARLAQATSALPGQIGARTAELRKGEQAARLAALQAAQAEKTALSGQQADILKAIGTLSPKAGQPLTEQDKASFGITGSQYADMPWVFDENGIPTIAGGQPAAAPTVYVGGEQVQLTPGQEAVDKKFGEQVFEWMSGGGQDMTGQIAQLGAVAQELEDIEAGTSDKDLTGVAVALTPEFVRAFTNPDSVDAREQVEEVVQRNLRLILGAQFTEREGERLIARAYNFRLGEGRNAARVRRLLLQMSTAAQQKQAMVDYFNENGTLAGYVGKMPTIVDFQNAIDGAEGFTSADLMGDPDAGLELIKDD